MPLLQDRHHLIKPVSIGIKLDRDCMIKEDKHWMINENKRMITGDKQMKNMSTKISFSVFPRFVFFRFPHWTPRASSRWSWPWSWPSGSLWTKKAQTWREKKKLQINFNWNISSHHIYLKAWLGSHIHVLAVTTDSDTIKGNNLQPLRLNSKCKI